MTIYRTITNITWTTIYNSEKLNLLLRMQVIQHLTKKGETVKLRDFSFY